MNTKILLFVATLLTILLTTHATFNVQVSRQNRRSLLIVFDTTKSMYDDLTLLRNAAKEIATNFEKRVKKPIYNYGLTLFNDPSEFHVFIFLVF